MGIKAKEVGTVALCEAISRLGLALAFETRTGMEIDRKSKWPVRGKYEYCLLSGERVVFKSGHLDHLEIYVEGMMEGRLTCPCLACKNHYHWFEIRERMREANAKKGKGARKKAGPYRRA
jgi:hypothetical protein